MATEIQATAKAEAIAEGRSTLLPPAAGDKRLVSLDAFRGWTMFWIVGGGAIVAGLHALSSNPLINGLVYELSHTDWQGLRFYDLIWPSFMLMTGMSLPWSYAKRSLTQKDHEIFMRVLRQLCGSFFFLVRYGESIGFHHPYLVELSSALQPIAVAYLAAFLIVRRSWHFQATVGASILVFYALLLAFVPAPGVSSRVTTIETQTWFCGRTWPPWAACCPSTGVRSSALFPPSLPPSWACCWANF